MEDLPSLNRTRLNSSFNLVLFTVHTLPCPLLLIGQGTLVAPLLTLDWPGGENHGLKYATVFASWQISSELLGCQGPLANQCRRPKTAAYLTIVFASRPIRSERRGCGGLPASQQWWGGGGREHVAKRARLKGPLRSTLPALALLTHSIYKSSLSITRFHCSEDD